MTMLTIDGRAVAGGAGTYPVYNPARPRDVVHEAPAASLAQLDEAIAAARRAQPAWAARDLEERLAILTRAADAGAAAATKHDLARLLAREHGKVLAEAAFETATVAFLPATFAEAAREALTPRRTPDGMSELSRPPMGVTAAILPFNWPVSVLGMKAVPALLAGNAVVVKTPPTCPGAVLAIAAAMAAELPPGVLAALNAPGPDLGAALVAHPGIDMVSFTGGIATGRAVMAAAAHSLKPLLLELGGNDPAIVCPDVDVTEPLIDRLFDAVFRSSGQVCMAIKRIYAPASRVRDLVAALVARGRHEVVGDGTIDGVTMGPLHTRRAVDFVRRLLADAESAGAVAHRTGRLRAEDAGSDGYFVLPTVVEGAPPRSSLVREEQFAPVIPVLPYHDLDDAVAQANDTPYGLSASIWTRDHQLASSLGTRLEAGTVWVNHHGTGATDPRMPFGGWKQSGFGQELGPEGVAVYTRARTFTRHVLP
jgi:acyl-CoA reductase-like NAD-dependent aldehyde dehydrogenase